MNREEIRTTGDEGREKTFYLCKDVLALCELMNVQPSMIAVFGSQQIAWLEFIPGKGGYDQITYYPSRSLQEKHGAKGTFYANFDTSYLGVEVIDKGDFLSIERYLLLI